MSEEVKNEQQQQEETVQQDGGGDGSQEKEPETVEMTQDEIDALIKKTFAKGARAGKREAQQEAPKKEEEAPKDDKAVAEAQRKLEEANQKLLKGSVRSLAADIGLTGKGANVAAKMACFEDCWDENGDLLDDEVKEVLTAFLKEYPEFAAEQKEAPPMYPAGTGKTPMRGNGMPGLKETQKELNKHRITG